MTTAAGDTTAGTAGALSTADLFMFLFFSGTAATSEHCFLFAVVVAATFVGVTLVGVTLVGVTFVGVTFVGVTLVGVTFAGVSFGGVTFAGVTFFVAAEEIAAGDTDTFELSSISFADAVEYGGGIVGCTAVVGAATETEIAGKTDGGIVDEVVDVVLEGGGGGGDDDDDDDDEDEAAFNGLLFFLGVCFVRGDDAFGDAFNGAVEVDGMSNVVIFNGLIVVDAGSFMFNFISLLEENVEVVVLVVVLLVIMLVVIGVAAPAAC